MDRSDACDLIAETLHDLVDDGGDWRVAITHALDPRSAAPDPVELAASQLIAATLSAAALTDPDARMSAARSALATFRCEQLDPEGGLLSAVEDPADLAGRLGISVAQARVRTDRVAWKGMNRQVWE